MTSAEALAAALIAGASIRVTTDALLLREACNELGVRLDVLSPFA